MVKVTIGIPVYNEERFLAATIESALNQTFADIDIIITDNCSTDNSYDIAKSYAEKDSRIKLIRHDENIGALANFKASLDLAKTDYFVWLGGHDIFLPNYIEAAVARLDTNLDVIMTYPKALMIDENHTNIGCADSNIDTLKVHSLRDRVILVVDNLGYCTSIHGLFRTQILRSFPCEQTIGSDNLMLFATAFYGHIQELHIIGILRRQFRIETTKDKLARWKEQKIYVDMPLISPWAILVFKHIQFICVQKNISVMTKFRLSFVVASRFTQKYGLTYGSIASLSLFLRSLPKKLGDFFKSSKDKDPSLN